MKHHYCIITALFIAVIHQELQLSDNNVINEALLSVTEFDV